MPKEISTFRERIKEWRFNDKRLVGLINNCNSNKIKREMIKCLLISNNSEAFAYGVYLELRRINLEGVDLSNFNFINVQFINSNLTNVNFVNSYFENVDIKYTDLRGTSFKYSALVYTYFIGCNPIFGFGIPKHQLICNAN